MKRNLPKSVPPAVLSAAHGALEKADDVIMRAGDAKRAYRDDAFLRAMRESRKESHLELMGKAQDLIEWGVMLLDSLPTDSLARRFGMSENEPCIGVVRHEIAFAPRRDFQGGILTTELRLMLDRNEGPFRHYDWFNDFRMNGGGQLRSANSVFESLHPEMLDGIHGLIAEGWNWSFIETSFDDLVDAFKDR